MKSLLVLFVLLASFSQIRGIELVVDRVLTKSEAAQNICLTKPSWTLLPNDRDCHKFYVCVNNDAEEFNCAANHYFDKTKLRCQLGVCPYAQTPSKCQQNAVQRVADNCNAFAVCKSGQLQPHQCAYGEYFNPRLTRCQPISTSADHKCSCILPEYALVPNVDDCETYYVCIDGKAVLQQCPRGQYYNERISSCLPDLEGVCLMAPTMSPKELDMVEECQQFGVNSAVLRSYPGDCAKFFLCVNGRVFTKRCPTGFYYDAKVHYCQVDKERACERKLQQKQQTELIETTGNTQHKPSPPKKLPQLLEPEPLQDGKNANNKNKLQPSVSQTVIDDKGELTKKLAALKENWMKKLQAQKLQAEKPALLVKLPENEATELEADNAEQTKAAQKQQLVDKFAALNKRLQGKPKPQETEPEKTTADKEQLMGKFETLKEKLKNEAKEPQEQMPEAAKPSELLVEKKQLGEQIEATVDKMQELQQMKKGEEKQQELNAKQLVEDEKQDVADSENSDEPHEAVSTEDSAADPSATGKEPHKKLIYDKLSSKFMNL